MVTPIVFDTKARRAFDRWAKKDKARTRSAIARDLKVSQPAVTNWLLGRARPDSDHRASIERLTGGVVLATDWQLPAERKAVGAVKPFETTGAE